MKKILGVVVLSFFLSTSAYTDNIKDFQIENISIGDSALDYFNESQLEENEQGWHNYNYTEYSTSYMPSKGIYNWFLVSYKNDDNNFIIEGLVAGLEKNNYDHKECNNKLDVVALNISELFKNTSQEEKKSYELAADSARAFPFIGKSSATSLSFNFLDGAKIILACYNMDKEAKKNESFLKSVLNQNDSFRIDVRSSTFVNYLKKLNL